jgi:HSP20 family protein
MERRVFKSEPRLSSRVAALLCNPPVSVCFPLGAPTGTGAASRLRQGAEVIVRVDVYEVQHELFVEAELPGVDPREIEILLNENVLTIRGKRGPAEPCCDRVFHCCERGSREFERHVALPFAVCREASRAILRDGLLTVRIPREESASVLEFCVPVD